MDVQEYVQAIQTVCSHPFSPCTNDIVLYMRQHGYRSLTLRLHMRPSQTALGPSACIKRSRIAQDLESGRSMGEVLQSCCRSSCQ